MANLIKSAWNISKELSKMIVKSDENMKKKFKWHKRFFDMANLVASWSKDPSSKIGAVIVDSQNRVIATGYNGFPVGVVDSSERLENREIKYKMVLHAEENAIMFAKQNLEGCSLYVTMMPPCSHCAALIVQSGIKHVYAPDSEIPERWKSSTELTRQMFDEAGVTLEFIKL